MVSSDMQISNYREIKNAYYSIVHRTKDWYESFPDVEITSNGKFLCSFTRATFHGGFYRTIMLSESEDGIYWKEPNVVGYPRNMKYYPWKIPKQILEEYDCSKIKKFADGHLEISIALSDVDGKRKKPALFVFRSEDNGETWNGPNEMNCQGLVQDDFLVNQNNPLERIVGLHLRNKKTQALNQYLYRSQDNGISWNSPELIAADGSTHFCEVSMCYIPGTEIITAFMRDNRRERRKIGQFFARGFPTQVCFSKDFGKNWTLPIVSSINGHRPVAKFLNDGRIMVTYRDIFQLGITGLWIADVNPKKIKFTPNTPNNFNDLFTNQKYYIIEKEDKYNAHGDNGYSGWVQDPSDEKITVVYYTKVGESKGKEPIRIKDKRAYIKCVKIDPHDL